MNGFGPSKAMWCRECYSSIESVWFPRKEKAIDGDKNAQDPMERQRLVTAWGQRHRPVNQYLMGQDRDHTMVPFECELCIFRIVGPHSRSYGARGRVANGLHPEGESGCVLEPREGNGSRKPGQDS